MFSWSPYSTTSPGEEAPKLRTRACILVKQVQTHRRGRKIDETAKRIILITGADSGIGFQTAIGLAKQNMHVVMVVRNMERGEYAKSEVVKQTGNISIDLRYCDLSSMSVI